MIRSVLPSRSGLSAPGNNPLERRTSMLGCVLRNNVKARGMIRTAAKGERQTLTAPTCSPRNWATSSSRRAISAVIERARPNTRSPISVNSTPRDVR